MEFTSIKDLVGPDGKIGPVQMRSALRLSIAAQEDAVSLYELIAISTDDPQIKKLMLDVANEQKVHVGQFKKLLNDRDPDNATKQQEGQVQARKKVEQQQPEEDRMRQLRGV